ncbi:A-kinase anchor protein 17A [Canna indica]|uniref:A-kinase anchor protein 17A n=1 Tax=Canna indica TaxID=4628 RepID=A0AAQ3KCG5_9LILI|nr:A-kinase anchor protein 17A [Canna indica]
MASSTAARRRSLHSLAPTEALELGGGLSLSPRVKLLLTFFRSDPAVKPIDEWKLKLALLEFLRENPLSLSVPDDDLHLRRRPDLHKRKRDEPVATGTLYVRDLGFLKGKGQEGADEDEGASRKKFFDWRSSFVEQLAGIDLNLEGVKYKMSVEIPPADDFEQLKNSWEDYYASQLLDSRRVFARRPDTIIVRGVPSRWFAEPRVSSKASMLVTHTIFSSLGKIRNLNVAADDDLGMKSDESKEEIISGLNCKVWVQFESYDDFFNAMKVLCGRSMQKEGSRLKVDYEVSWDKEGYFRSVQQKDSRNHRQERDMARHTRNETSTYQPHATFDSYGARRKRFRE